MFCPAPPPPPFRSPDTVNVTTADAPDGARGGPAVYIVSPCNCEVLETEAQADARHKARRRPGLASANFRKLFPITSGNCSLSSLHPKFLSPTTRTPTLEVGGGPFFWGVLVLLQTGRTARRSQRYMVLSKG